MTRNSVQFGANIDPASDALLLAVRMARRVDIGAKLHGVTSHERVSRLNGL
jgi:hypothetical protein